MVNWLVGMIGSTLIMYPIFSIFTGRDKIRNRIWVLAYWMIGTGTMLLSRLPVNI